MDWRSQLTDEERKILDNGGSADFARVVRRALTLGMFSAAKKYMTAEEAKSFDAYRHHKSLQQLNRASFGSEERSWFEQIEAQVARLVDNAIIQIDNNTGGWGQRGTVWVEKRLADMSESFQKWWKS